jgi:hypothetical protein
VLFQEWNAGMSENEQSEAADQKQANPSRLRDAPPGMRELMKANANGLTDGVSVPMSEEEKEFAEALQRHAERLKANKLAGPERFKSRKDSDEPGIG